MDGGWYGERSQEVQATTTIAARTKALFNFGADEGVGDKACSRQHTVNTNPTTTARLSKIGLDRRQVGTTEIENIRMQCFRGYINKACMHLDWLRNRMVTNIYFFFYRPIEAAFSWIHN